MITSKYFWKNEEIVIFNSGKENDKLTKFRFYHKSNVPKDIAFPIINDPDESILYNIARYSGSEVVRRYYVTPPDKLEWWMGTYVYYPSGTRMHCDPIDYGSENNSEDISETLASFMSKYGEQVTGIPGINK